jgi:hypothetical protein
MSNNTISEQGIKMEIEEAFDQIVMRLQAASGRGVTPSIRVSGDDWVCTIEQPDDKFIIIAKEKELLLVHMESQNEPDIDRAGGEDYNQQDTIERIRQAIAIAYGTPVQ